MWRENAWALAEHAGLTAPQPFEHLLGGATWDPDALRDFLRGYVVSGVSGPDGRGTVAALPADAAGLSRADLTAAVRAALTDLRG
jgi:hypothetical protein